MPVAFLGERPASGQVVSRGTRGNALIAGAIVLAAAVVNIGFGAGLPVAPDDSEARVASKMSVFYGSWLVALALGVALTRPRVGPRVAATPPD